MMSTSVTGPNMAKYSLSFSELVCQLRPPTNSFEGDGEVVPVFVGVGAGVERPLDGAASVKDGENIEFTTTYLFTCKNKNNSKAQLLRISQLKISTSPNKSLDPH